MVDGSTRLGVFVKILLPLMGPGLVATSVFAFITTWNEYIFARVLLNDQSKQTVTVWLSYFLGIEPPHRLGRADGRLDADGDPGRRLLPARPAEDRVRADRRSGAGMSDSLAARLGVHLPELPRCEPPDWIRRFVADGGGGLVLFAYNVPSRRGARGALSVAVRAERDDVLLGIDEEGGDVTRLEWRTGSSYPGGAVLGVARRAGDDRGRRGVDRLGARRRPASTGTSRRSPTSTCRRTP